MRLLPVHLCALNVNAHAVVVAGTGVHPLVRGYLGHGASYSKLMVLLYLDGTDALTSGSSEWLFMSSHGLQL
jgi:hypothetical protein